MDVQTIRWPDEIGYDGSFKCPRSHRGLGERFVGDPYE